MSVSVVSPQAIGFTRPGTWTHLRRNRPERNQVLPNLVEHRRSALVWTERLLQGNRESLRSAHRANARAAAAEAGAFDLIHAHVAYPGGWVAMQLAEEVGVPLVITEHMSPFPFPSLRDATGDLRPTVRQPLERASAVIAVSPALATDIGAFGLPEPHVVPNLVDETFFTPAERHDEGPLNFFTLAALVPQKAVGDLLEAIAALSLQSNEAQFRIGGGGDRAHEYQALAAELGLKDLVRWLGPLSREAAREEYRRADCVVVASRHESFGVVLAEAMACGVPVLATRSGGPDWIVTPETGILVDAGQPQALAGGLQQMLVKARGYDRALIRRRLEERFSRAAVVDSLADVYADVVRRS